MRNGQDYLSNMAEIIQSLGGKKMNYANFSQHAPPGAIGCKGQVMIVISKVVGAGIGWPTGKIGIVDLNKHVGSPI